jgi:hypothetical protein
MPAHVTQIASIALMRSMCAGAHLPPDWLYLIEIKTEKARREIVGVAQ